MDELTRPEARAAAAPGRRYAAFLSYCHADRVQAEALHRFLETYRLPRDLPPLADSDSGPAEARLRPVFIDRADMPAGTDLRDEIDAALMASRALVVVCSPAAAKSRWVQLEIERFKQQHGDAPIFAVIIAGVAHGSETAEHAPHECFPPALRQRLTAKGPVRIDPAAVDLRRSGDGPLIGRLRLVAGLIGVPLDQLVHRDARRRHQRTLALVIGLALALAGTAALALYALAARNEAQRQRFAAEGMIELMVGDLKKTLTPLGRLSAMDPLGQRALAYYQQQDPGALDAVSLARRARVLMLVGEIQDQRGNLDAALRNFQTAATTTSELLNRSPDDPQRIFDHAQSVYWVGFIAYRRGNIATAEPAFKEYSHLAERLVEINPANPDYQAENGYAYGNLGTMWFTTGRNADAEAAFRKALAVSARLAARTSSDSPEKFELALSHVWLGHALQRQGKVEAATTELETARVLLEAMLAADALNGAARDELARLKRAQAQFALEAGDNARALSLAEEAVREAKVMATTDSSNAEATSLASSSYLTLGETLMANGDVAGSARAAAVARHYGKALIARDRTVATWQLNEVRETLLRAKIAAALDKPDDALALATAALDKLRTMPASGRDDSDARWLRNSALLQAGEALRAMGMSDAAAIRFAAVLNDKSISGAGDEPRIAVLKAQAAAFASAAPKT